MNRYAAVPWPWLGLVALLVLLGQELVLKLATGPQDPGLVTWRIATMAAGLSSLALLLLPAWRPSMLLGAIGCGVALAFALYAQYGLGLDPCPLCIFQRVAVVFCGAVFLLGAIHNPGRVGAAVYSILLILGAGAGAGVAGRQVWLQTLPPDKVPACGAGLGYMMETMPFNEVLATVLKGTGDCAKVDWRFLDLSLPAWTLVFFAGVIVVAIALTRRG